MLVVSRRTRRVRGLGRLVVPKTRSAYDLTAPNMKAYYLIAIYMDAYDMTAPYREACVVTQPFLLIIA